MAGPGSQAATATGRDGLKMMSARIVLGVLAVIFIGLALLRIVRERKRIGPASRTWLTIGIIFALVSGYLWMSG